MAYLWNSDFDGKGFLPSYKKPHAVTFTAAITITFIAYSFLISFFKKDHSFLFSNCTRSQISVMRTLLRLTMQKWRQIEVMRRMRFASSSSSTSSLCSWNNDSKDGHFVVYSMDKSRFVIPLKLLESRIIVELLKMSEDEFGFSNDTILLPFESCTMNQIIRFLSSRQQGDEYRHQLEQGAHFKLLVHNV